MSYINFLIKNSNGNNVEITTFYKNNLFKILRVYIGNLNNNDDARPYQILQFNYIKGNITFYFINLHNGHLISKEKIEEIINNNNIFLDLNSKIYYKNINIKYKNNEYTIFNNNKKILNLSINEEKNKKEYPIIIAGDFNDHGKYFYWKKGLNIIKNVNIPSKKTPPLTCCTPTINNYIWLGAPSLIYNPNIRNKILNIDINFIFDITTFNSSACIRDNSKNNKDFNLYKTYKGLNTFCNNNKYRSHNCLSGKLKKFINNIIDAKEKILYEQKILNKYFREENYQRYNEILTYFFPWEVIGIEIGGQKKEVCIELHKNIMEKRYNFIENYNILINNDEQILKLINLINNKNYELSSIISIDNYEYILIKFLKFYCSNKKKYNIKIKYFKTILSRIIAELKNPINYYEYGRYNKNSFFNLYKIKNKVPLRNTNFELFEQNADENFLTKITKCKLSFKSTLNYNKNLINNYDNKDYIKFNKKNIFPYVLRCLIIDTNNLGKINLDNAINEFFNGRIKINNDNINIVVNPSTIILPNSNVILTSQIFDRDFNKNLIIKNINSYKKYFNSLNIGLRDKKYNNDIKFGDYFLISNDFEFTKDNSIPINFNRIAIDENNNAVNPTSDHLPVEVKIKLKIIH